MRALVTNDDGIDAPGIEALARAVHEAGHEAIVVAPLGERSGAGAAIGTLSQATELRLERRTLPGLDDVEAVGLDAPPALCVITARLGAFGDLPEVVVSGINPGLNTGRAILHSGTVGAALTAANHGISGLAVSIAGERPTHWATAAELAVHALDWLAAAPLRTVLNLNVPDLPIDEVRGVCWATPAALGEWHAVVAESGPSVLRLGLRRTEVELPPDSDTALVAAGFAAVTLLQPPAPGQWAPVADHLEQHLEARRPAADVPPPPAAPLPGEATA
ncbi:MAG: 5'/3'-nucleotidase SurE [Acidimicrobiales bacterium]|nr:5'/3'-nucleotidase SurE [Acidimicrobiales bacterium]HRW36527.1 5'/3'-nucleotidase SurE [Aquihabitans sp.]